MKTQTPWLRTALFTAVGAIVLGVIGLLIWLGFRWFQRAPETIPAQKISFQTTDGVEIVANLYQPEDPARAAAILVPMLAETKESWQSLASRLAEEGVAAIAIDMRGHGESTKRDGSTLKYQEFSDAQFQESQRDIEAAIQWTSNSLVPEDKIFLIGASMGANLSLETLAEHPKLRGAILISPGINYRGVLAEAFIQKIRPPQQLYLMASTDDFYALETVHRLAPLSPVPTVTNEVDGNGHGTQILVNTPQTIDKLVQWVTTYDP